MSESILDIHDQIWMFQTYTDNHWNQDRIEYGTKIQYKQGIDLQ